MTQISRDSAGRPPIEFEWDLLNKTLARGGRMADCVYLMGVSASTIERRLREEHDLAFSEYRELQLTGIRMRILDTQTEVALKQKDPMMLKHLGEHFCGQITKTQNQNQNLNVSTSVEAYLKRINEESENAG